MGLVHLDEAPLPHAIPAELQGSCGCLECSGDECVVHHWQYPYTYPRPTNACPPHNSLPKGQSSKFISATCKEDCKGLRHCHRKLTWPRPHAGRPPPHLSTSVWQTPSGRRPRAPLASPCHAAAAAGRLLVDNVSSKPVITEHLRGIG